MENFILKSTTKDLQKDLIGIAREQLFVKALREGNSPNIEGQKKILYMNMKRLV